MGRGGLTPPPLQTAPGCGGQWCWSVFFSLPSSQRERKRSRQRARSLARNHQSQESRVNVTWAPKLTPQNTKKYTGTGKCACWWDITRNDCACCKKGVGAMQCGFPMHKFCYKKSDMGCPGVCNYKYTLSGKCYPCFSDHSNTDCAWCNKNGWQCEQNAITGPDSKREPLPSKDEPEVLRVPARGLQAHRLL